MKNKQVDAEDEGSDVVSVSSGVRVECVLLVGDVICASHTHGSVVFP